MANFFTPKGVETAAGIKAEDASNVGKTKTARAVNTHASNAYVLTMMQAAGVGGTTNVDSATITLAPMESVIVFKNPTDVLFANNAAIKLSNVSFPKG